MSAFGRRNGAGGMQPARPAFGVARPMTTGSEAAQGAPMPGQGNIPGGNQFPPLPQDDPLTRPVDATTLKADAMTRLTDRANAVVENQHHAEGFEASVHKIKEQVLPRLLEHVDQG
jgi:pilus assembly protein CpaF